MPSVFMTVDGRQEDTTRAIRESQAQLGIESTKDWIAGNPPQFVDYPFTDPSAGFEFHKEVVKQLEPTIAVAPDIENGRTLETVIRQADELADHADTVVVVPKSVHPQQVPDRFRVGVPLATFGSGAQWTAWDYHSCSDLHLLGGGPATQLAAGKHLRVASVDTSALCKLCKFGLWNGISTDAPDDWNYQKRLKESLDNYVEAWQ